MKKVELEHMLAARDRRVDIQNSMLEAGGGECCVACLTLNIAGEVKRTPMTKMLFDRGVSGFEGLGFEVEDSRLIDGFTGSEAFWLVREDAGRVKKCLEEIEDSFPAARLFDFDVLAADGAKLSRAESRRCLICDRPAAECARSRAHGLESIKQATQTLLKDFCAGILSEQAYEALLSEVYATPKPGLVDLNNNGAHSDMDVDLFEKSAEALKPYFYDAARLGMDGCGMPELRERGLAAEQEMYAATGGVNTHKGMVYSMGLLLAGMGMALADTAEGGDDGTDTEREGTGAESDGCPQAGGLRDRAIRNAAGLAGQDAERMLATARADPATNGAAALRDYGALGATGHAASGFPDAVYAAERLAYYIYKEGIPRSAAGPLTLCDSMAKLEDTNLLHRGGTEGLDFTKKRAAEISAMPIKERAGALEALDIEMTDRNLSPGGSADMLALAFLLSDWDRR